MNQWVDLGKNHHVLIYKDFDDILKEEVVTFWTVVERKRQGEEVFKLPEDGKEVVTILQINDMFILGLNEDEIDWENLNYNLLKKHLFKVQALSSFFYEFRLSTDSTQNKDNKSKVFRRIQNFGEGKTGWFKFNPLKVKLNSMGVLKKL